ncbi:MAG: aminomethyl-transferring glycine dehydrogenase subunit GcvPB [Eubacteriales bacterium]
MKDYNKLIIELSKKGRKAYSIPKNDVDTIDAERYIPKNVLRKEDPNIPEVYEVDVMRHYTNLSNKNYGVDTGFYPLGSCTMKYNPKINEDMAKLPNFANIHPRQSEDTVQGSLELMYDLQEKLCEITGTDGLTLQPAAGAHGELTGLMIIKKYHEERKDTKRTKIIVPDSAHGTNPASATAVGYDIIEIKSRKDGSIDLDELKEALSDEVAGLMLTNPSTLGLFERNICEISKLVHEAGGLVYYDGANLNAIMGKTRPGDMGFDIVHLNLHKTFSTPHGGGGPGAGPVGVRKDLIKYLPVPVVGKEEGKYYLDYDKPSSIGRLMGFYGNFGVLLKAYTYILKMGASGLKEASETAVLNANYLQSQLKKEYKLPIDQVCKHEFVLSSMKDLDIHTLDIAKRLLDYGVHPPTVYFPLIIDEAIMVEPTDTETLETLDNFIEIMNKIKEEAKENPNILEEAPTTTPVRRLDEVKAARKPKVKWD